MDLYLQNKYVFTILNRDKNTYSVFKSTEEVYFNGERVKLMDGCQARNNKRIVILGSTDICSDKFYYLSMTEDNKSMLDSPNAVFSTYYIKFRAQEKHGIFKFIFDYHRTDLLIFFLVLKYH